MITKEEVKIKPGKLFIDGKWVDSVSGKTFDTINPATEEVITLIPELNPRLCRGEWEKLC